MNFGAMLPDVKASLPVSGQHVSADLHAVERACVPGIEADCAHSPFTSIMVRPIYIFPVLPIVLILPARRLVLYYVEHPSAPPLSNTAPARLQSFQMQLRHH